MQICVCGWYFLTNPKVLDDLKKLNKQFPVFIVSHQTSKEADEILQASGLNYQIIPNIGLEFGSYDFFIKVKWDQINNILFMHDDIDIQDIDEFYRIAKLTCDHAYIFQDKIEEDINQHRHGRMIYLSARIIKKMLNTVCDCKYAYDWIDQEHNPGCVIQGSGPHTGFWFDPYNYGHTCGKPPVYFSIHHEQNQVSEPKSIWHYNHGMFHFDKQMGSYRNEFDVRHLHYAPGLFIGRRNHFRENYGDKYYKVQGSVFPVQGSKV